MYRDVLYADFAGAKISECTVSRYIARGHDYRDVGGRER